MAEYAPGMRVIIRGEEWMIKKLERNSMGNQALFCLGISALVKDRESIFLEDLEKIEISQAADTILVCDTSPNFRQSRLYIESQWRRKIPTDEYLHIGHRAQMNLLNYQLLPAQRALSKIRQRILIADSVGLGKTLEAGILMSELIARGKGRRILVVTVKSMMEQFQKEMWHRFTIPLVRLDSAKIHKIKAELPTNYNPFNYYDKTIVSIDTIKRDIEYRTHLEKAYWDIIVIDEAHNVAERGEGAQRARLAQLLSKHSDTMIMLSATPHDGRARSFASLMNMLDPTAIANPDNYTKDDIEGLCVRRFKKDVKDQVADSFKERKVTVMPCKPSSAEEYAWNIFADLQLYMDADKPVGSGKLFKTFLEKSMFSSPNACVKSIENRIRKLQDNLNEFTRQDIEKLNELKAALVAVTAEKFSRYQVLLGLLNSHEYGWNRQVKDDRVVIFTERIETMKFLSEQLRKDLSLGDGELISMSGQMSDVEQQEIVKQFQDINAKVRILVASDVASEGINLHYLCHRMIHFEVPWSLMRFQQRNGRVDRYGQKKQPDIRYMYVDSSNPKVKGDARIFAILIKKEQAAYENIGDPAMLMKQFTIEGEELFVAKLIENGVPEDLPDAVMDEEAGADANEDDWLQNLLEESSSGHSDYVQPAESESSLFKDMDYVKAGIEYLNCNGQYHVEEENNTGFKVLNLNMTGDIYWRLHALIPEDVMPVEGQKLCLSDNISHCNDEMQKSLVAGANGELWRTTQYLWPLHPIFEWLNDKISIQYKRNEAPVIAIDDETIIKSNQSYFLMSAVIPNKKAQPVIDELFAILFEDGNYVKILPVEEFVQIAGLRKSNLVNSGLQDELLLEKLSALRQDAVKVAYAFINDKVQDYNRRINPQVDAEVNKLAEKHQRHLEQLDLFSDQRNKQQKKSSIESIFEEYVDWVKDSLEIENNPYVRIVAVVTGVAK